MEDTYRKFLKKEYENADRKFFGFAACIILFAIVAFFLTTLLVVNFATKNKATEELRKELESIPGNIYAVHISTNLVSTPCNCGYCRPSEGIRVPEHINQIGYDLKVVVSTSYYPVVILKKD